MWLVIIMFAAFCGCVALSKLPLLSYASRRVPAEAFIATCDNSNSAGGASIPAAQLCFYFGLRLDICQLVDTSCECWRDGTLGIDDLSACYLVEFELDGWPGGTSAHTTAVTCGALGLSPTL